MWDDYRGLHYRATLQDPSAGHVQDFGNQDRTALHMMASSSLYYVSREEFLLFHSIDRELYTVLVKALCRNPTESMQIMALWMWLERMGYTNVVKKILSLPYILINELADETVTCLGCTATDQFVLSPDQNDIPLLQSLMSKEISLRYFHDNRVRATQGVAKVVNEVCIRAFNDIMQQAIEQNSAQSLIDGQARTTTPPASMRPEAVFGSVTQEADVAADDRTMFVTFSRGYHVQEREVRDFFGRNFGDCIESLHMEEVTPDEQPLFARIVLRSLAYIQAILKGNVKVKFTINGKHVWARKFVPKRAKPSVQLPNFPPPVTHPPLSFGSFGY